MNAKLRIKADSSKTNPKGMIWSAGIHHVFVDDKPAKVYVPQYTVLDTFNHLTEQLKRDGSVKFGVDHLPDTLYNDNKILAKMKLDDVGEINKVVYDGESIYIQDSQLTNKEIERLHNEGELPAYSIVGAMEASPCPSERADYVVDNIVIDRVDFVEEGGCQECRTGVEPGEILITSKKSNMEAKSMSESEVEEQKDVGDESVPDASIKETVEQELKEEKEEEKGKVDDGKEALATEEPEQEAKEPEQEEQKEREEEEKVDEDEGSDDLIQSLRKEIAELKKVVDGKKPSPVSAKQGISDETRQDVKKLIEAGRATPNMKTSLERLRQADPEAFKEYSEQLDQVVDYSVKSKLAPIPEKEKEKEPSVDDVLRAMGRGDLVKE